jgi:hypothetical protein
MSSLDIIGKLTSEISLTSPWVTVKKQQKRFCWVDFRHIHLGIADFKVFGKLNADDKPLVLAYDRAVI